MLHWLLSLVAITFLSTFRLLPSPQNGSGVQHRVLFCGDRVLLEGSLVPACILVEDGRVVQVRREEGKPASSVKTDEWGQLEEVVQAGHLVLMPGVVDSHVHINEPGRTQWEGYDSATRAGAAGGITTIVDMPLNSIPPTTTLENLETKLQVAEGKCHVDVAFWGGAIPGNENELRPLVRRGVVGFKSFLSDSGVPEFPALSPHDVGTHLEKLKGTGSVLAFHSEVLVTVPSIINDDPHKYSTYLKTRPKAMENQAVELVVQQCMEHEVRCHVVHLSSDEGVPILRRAKSQGANITVETCHHYLLLDAESIPDGATQYKCAPPIREKANQEELWAALKEGVLDQVVSDHSPCTPDLKKGGDFIKAWGGIASVQFGLSLLWTGARQHNMSISKVSHLLSTQPATLCRLQHRKGAIKVGMDADFVIWDPDESFTVEENMILHKNKLTPYLGMQLYGKVHKTYVRGQLVFDQGTVIEPPKGHLLLDSRP